MREHGPFDDDDGRIPPLLRFLGLHLILGAAVGIAIASLIILINLAGLKDLLVETREPFIALLLLYSFNVITFSSVSMGIGIMTLPFDPPDPRIDAENREPPHPRPSDRPARRDRRGDQHYD